MLRAKQSVSTILAANARPQNEKSGSVILIESWNKRQTHGTTTGERTQLGRYYEEMTANNLPVGGFNSTRAPFREGTMPLWEHYGFVCHCGAEGNE